MGGRFEALPTGTVTFLFSDVEGSTRLWDEHPEAMRHSLERHDAILREVFGEHGGYVFTTAGDSFAAAFQDPGVAALAASSAQEALQRENWPAEAPLRVRMGLHTGRASERDGDYFGPTLNVTARMMNAGHGGQVLVSAETNRLLRDVKTRSLGVHRLKDLSAALEIFQLIADGARFPPLRTLDRARHNLPVVSGSLLGRQSAVTGIAKLVETMPLVTVVGVGGIGKTRLALGAGAEVVERFDDGVWFCDLAQVDESDAVIHVVADAIGTRQRPGQSGLESVAEFCRDRRMLVVLDNCEHVLDAVADVVETVTAIASRVRFVATSREALGLAIEVTYPLGSLEVGSASPAVELFIDRAARMDPTRTWSEAEGVAIEGICARLDGIPLAIELAAARTRSMTPVDIENNLDDAFRTLHGGRRSIERHRTLRAAVEWSYVGLGEPARVLFDRLAAFSGSCDLEAVEEVGADDNLIKRTDVAELLDDLVSKSLVVTASTRRGTTRYRLLEPLRQFAEDRLDQSGQLPAIRTRHLEHYTRWAEAWNADVWGAGLDLVDRLDAEFANLRSAVGWATQTASTDSALRIVRSTASAQFGWLRLEVADWAIRTLALDDVKDHHLGPAVAAGVAISYWSRADTDQFGACLDWAEAAPTYDPTALEPTVQRAIWALYVLDDPHTARALLDRVEPRDARERALLAFTRIQLLDEIGAEFDDDLATLRRDAAATGSALIAVLATGSSSMAYASRFDFDAALRNAREAVDGALAIGAHYLENLFLLTLGVTAAATSSVTPRDLLLIRNGLRQQRDAGAESDQWLLLVASAAALDNQPLAEQIQCGMHASLWANSRLAVVLPLLYPDMSPPSDPMRKPPDLCQLVDDVLSAIDHTCPDVSTPNQTT